MAGNVSGGRGPSRNRLVRPTLKSNRDTLLAKRLCYLLRYGALKEKLTVHGQGYVDVDELRNVGVLRSYSRADILEEIDTSRSHRAERRFEKKTENGRTYVRAVFGRKFEKNPCHEGTRVFTLMNLSMQFICANLNLFDFETFPDEYLLSCMIHELKRQKKMSVPTLKALLSPVLERLNLEGCYLTESAMKCVWTKCPDLKMLSLADCGYIMTDSLAEQIVKKLPHLQSLNLSGCSHLTDKTVKALCRYCQNLKRLNLCYIPRISEEMILLILQSCPSLTYLDVFDHTITPEGLERILHAAKDKITVIHKDLPSRRFIEEFW